MKRHSPDLHAAVKMYPTPAAQDYKNITLPPSQIKRATLPGARLRLEAWRTPQFADWKSSKKQAGHTKNLTHQVLDNQEDDTTLNPAWVEILMGFPPGWTDITGLPDLEKSNTTGSHPEQSQNDCPIEPPD